MTRPKPLPAAPGKESVWDYPRPPRLEPIGKGLRVVFGGVTLAETIRGLRVLETSHPPVYYFPPDDVRRDCLKVVRGTSFCEWKGQARYFDIEVDGNRARRAAWSYPAPTPDFAALRDCVAFYCQRVDACLVGAETARPQPGGFYGGWITDDIVGPFKGVPGSTDW